MNDIYNLQRFVEAQEQIYDTVLSELTAGQKRSHWMWFIFPQIKGLGTSRASQWFAIASRDETQAYLEHPILGTRLKECTQIVMNIDGRSAEAIFGGIDACKFRSCMTLFEYVAAGGVFRNSLLKYFDGGPDLLTLDILRRL